MTEQRATDRAPAGADRQSMRVALLAIWSASAGLVLEMAQRLADRSLLIKIRGYIVVAVGVLIVSKFLTTMIGVVPGVPTEFSAGLIVATVLLAMLFYRQTIAALRHHDLRTRDQLAALRRSGVGRGLSSEAARLARERHWRARRATIWGLAAFVALMAYAFALNTTVKTAYVPDVEEAKRVIVPPVLPEPIKSLVETQRQKNPLEPLDDLLTESPGLFIDMLPNEYPEYVQGTALTLHAVYVAFCMFVTRAFAFAVAPPPEAAPALERTHQLREIKTKDLPDGDDGFDAALDIADDVIGSL